MRMHVNEPRRHCQPLRIDLTLARRRHPSNLRDSISAHSHIAVKPGIAGAVDDAPVANHQVVLFRGKARKDKGQPETAKCQRAKHYQIGTHWRHFVKRSAITFDESFTMMAR